METFAAQSFTLAILFAMQAVHSLLSGNYVA